MSQICVEPDIRQGQAQYYTKCGDNAILAQLSANFAVEVILRNSFDETSNRFVILNRDDTCYMRKEVNTKRVSVEAKQPACSHFSRTLFHQRL